LRCPGVAKRIQSAGFTGISSSSKATPITILGTRRVAAVESFVSSLKTERVSRKIYRTREEARADVFDDIERFYNPHRRHSTLSDESPKAFEAKMRVA
jgi:transposase InsO family protein